MWDFVSFLKKKKKNQPQQAVQWTVEWPVMLDAMTLMWRHSNMIIDCIAVRYKAPKWKYHFNKIIVHDTVQTGVGKIFN